MRDSWLFETPLLGVDFVVTSFFNDWRGGGGRKPRGRDVLVKPCTVK